jgi:hypothetical protein
MVLQRMARWIRAITSTHNAIATIILTRTKASTDSNSSGLTTAVRSLLKLMIYVALY